MNKKHWNWLVPLFCILFIFLPVVEGKIKLKTNQATVIYCGPFYDFSDGVTPEVSMTVTNITCELFKYTVDGSAPTRTVLTLSASAGDNDMVHIASDVAGMYSLELTAANINFLGEGRIVFTDPDVMLGVWEDIEVVSANVRDSILGTDLLQVDMTEISTSSAAANAQEARLVDATWVANNLAYFDGTGLSVATFTTDAITQANIETYSETGATASLVAIDLDHLLSLTTGVAADGDLEAYVSAGTVMAHLMGIAADVTEYDATEDSMEAQGTHLNTIEADTAAIEPIVTDLAGIDEIVAAVWASAMSDLAVAAPSATASIKTAINWLYEAWRNKTVTTSAGEVILYKDDSTTPLTESDVSDDGTDFTKGKWGVVD